MQSTTLGIALVAVGLILALRPPKALAIYVAVLLFYPSYLVLRLGTVDISAIRIVLVVLFVKCCLTPRLTHRLRWNAMDAWVLAYIFVGILVMGSTLPIRQVLENRAGYVIDAWFAYMVARLCLSDKPAAITAFKWISCMIGPLAVLGVLEMAGVSQPYAGLERYCPWLPDERITEARFNFTRAKIAFGHPIMAGIAFSLLLPVTHALRKLHGCWRTLAWLFSGSAILGVISSLSSAPYMTSIFILGCFGMEHFKRLVKPVLICCVIGCVFIGIVSNRPIYHVIASYANPLSGAGWHRAKIIDCAIRDFGDWYLAGSRGQDPGWGSEVGMAHTDITNEYIIAGVRYGILGVFTFSGMLVAGLRVLLRTYRTCDDSFLRSCTWALGGTLVTMMITFMAVSIFSQVISLFFSFLGIIASSASLSCAAGLQANHALHKRKVIM